MWSFSEFLGESWVWKGYSLFNDKPGNRAILKLSKAGSDSVVLREFDLTEKKFVKDMGEPAFDVPDAKSSAHWVDINTVIVQTKLPNTTNDGLTDSGYPRIAKLWKRGNKIYFTPPPCPCMKKDLHFIATTIVHIKINCILFRRGPL